MWCEEMFASGHVTVGEECGKNRANSFSVLRFKHVNIV